MLDSASAPARLTRPWRRAPSAPPRTLNASAASGAMLSALSAIAAGGGPVQRVAT